MFEVFVVFEAAPSLTVLGLGFLFLTILKYLPLLKGRLSLQRRPFQYLAPATGFEPVT